jgi:two-component system NtrC family sensor kinase
LKASQKEGEHSKIIDFLELISSESARCGRIVKDLLLFSHGEKDEVAKEDLIKIIDKGATVIKHHLEMHGVSLEKDFPDNPVEICCNAQKIQQAVMSLLINAIEAMPHGGKITIRLTNEKKLAVLRVIDEGTGISEKDMPHIFEPFYSTKEAATGTGLGLAVVYGIVANHNGLIEVEKTSVQGTTFKVSLPQNEQKI